MENPPPAPLSACGTLLRQGDKARFLTALLAPAEAREGLFALYAFNLEVAKTREMVSEPMLGQIRLQWWRETLGEIFAGQTPRKHEVVTPLADTIRRFALPHAPFAALIDGREQDLQMPPPGTEAEFAAYLDATGGMLGRLAAQITGADPEQAALRASAYAKAGTLIGIARRAQLGRVDLPLDRLGAAGLTARSIRDGVPSEALSKLVLAFTQEIEQSLATLPRARRAGGAALLTGTLARRLMKGLKAAGGDPFLAAAQLRARPDGLLPLHLWWALRLGRL
ncbi:phytoene/squalene synthase family protein [Elstera litoralis]|uniref:phytoene/squalene synthase family protein n=1 Tax=Elstera litoralis TaxID=552518 RepID=UPI000B10F5FB|nr:squalene/phytoene synthase family protein [Elstera litoralis]